MADKLDDKGFLQRWSARKMDARAGTDVDAPQSEEGSGVADPSAVGAVAAAAPPSDVPSSDAPVPNLPDVETLDADSDYTAFLGENVPEDLAKLAMRKLWRSDPVLANIDGLNDYDEDFSLVGMVSETVKTAYQVGKGYVVADDQNSDEDGDEIDSGDEFQTEDEVSVEDAPQSDEKAGEKDQDNQIVTADTQMDVDLTEQSERSEFHNVELPKPHR